MYLKGWINIMNKTRKNGSNRYVVRITHLLDGILYCSLIITLVVFFQFTLFGEWSILDFGEKVMSVLGWISLPMFIFILIMFIKYPNFVQILNVFFQMMINAFT